MQILPKSLLDEAPAFLPYSEALERFDAEKLQPQLDQYRLYDHASFKDFERRKGLVLHSSEFLLRLSQLDPSIRIHHQINFSDDWGIYADRGSVLAYLSAVPKGWLTEFSYALVDERDLPSEERRGWRTVLLRLLAFGVLTWRQVEKEFGDSEGFNSERWLTYTAPYRNADGARVVWQNVGNQME